MLNQSFFSNVIQRDLLTPGLLFIVLVAAFRSFSEEKLFLVNVIPILIFNYPILDPQQARIISFNLEDVCS